MVTTDGWLEYHTELVCTNPNCGYECVVGETKLLDFQRKLPDECVTCGSSLEVP